MSTAETVMGADCHDPRIGDWIHPVPRMVLTRTTRVGDRSIRYRPDGTDVMTRVTRCRGSIHPLPRMVLTRATRVGGSIIRYRGWY